MILIYNKLNALFHDGQRLLPGSNVVPDNFDVQHPSIADMIEDGSIEIVNSGNEAAEKKAIRRANTQETAEKIAAGSKSKEVKAAAKKRKEELDGVDKEIAEAIKKEREQKQVEED